MKKIINEVVMEHIAVLIPVAAISGGLAIATPIPKEEPVAPVVVNDSQTGMALNRRVTVKLVP